MTPRTIMALTAVAAAVLACTISMLLAVDKGTVGYGAGALGMLLCWTVFLLWPWLIIPVAILGGTIASALIGAGDIRSIVVLHSLPLAAGFAALVTRRLIGLDLEERRLPLYGVGMVIILATTGIGAMYGLAAGNDAEQVLIASYQIAIIPLYFLVTAYSLATDDRRKKAAIVYIGTIAVITALEFTAPGRHGGLLTLIAVPPLIVLAGQTKGWNRFGLAVLAGGLSVDVVLASYRGLWLAGGIVLVIMVIRGGDVVLRGLAATAAAVVTGTVLFLSFGFGSGLLDRFSVVSDSVTRSPGYRVPEAVVGWNVFADQPLIGAGLGQSTPRIYIPGFAVTDVGPIYHSYYVVVLANLGLIGLVAVFWPIARTTWAGLTQRDPMPIAFAALTCGFLVAALVESPTDGHWELGLIPALTLLTLAGGAFDRPLKNRRGEPAVRPAVVTPS